MLMREAIRLLVIVLCCLLVFPAGVNAQRASANNAAWDAMSGLDEGTRLLLKIRDDGEHDVEFVKQNERFMVVRNALQSTRQYERDRIEAVWRFDPPKRGRNALIGFLVGAAIGAGVAAVTVKTGRDFAHPGGMGIVGGAVGAGIGAWISSSSRVLLYRSAWR